MTNKNIFFLPAALCFAFIQGNSQCVSESNIYSFEHNGKSYEVVRENKSWADAAACAIERGGSLAIIDDSTEQAIINDELANSAGITVSNTTAPDGGGGAYIWLGGNDFNTEGNWVWDANGDSTGTEFWTGDANGSAQNGAYTNWGNEPDNFNNQDALGLSLNGWPLGTTGQWNDVDHTNTLYFLIEKPKEDNKTGQNEPSKVDSDIRIYPNPAIDKLQVNAPFKVASVKLISLAGQIEITEKIESHFNFSITLDGIPQGMYFLQFQNVQGMSFISRIVVE